MAGRPCATNRDGGEAGFRTLQYVQSQQFPDEVIYSLGMKVIHVNAGRDEWVRVHRPKPPGMDDLGF
jgi:hypothetical protein